MKLPKNCPHCNTLLDKADIFEHFLKKYGNEEKALESSSYYGWKKEEPCCFSRLISVYSWEEDRTMYHMCPDCKGRIER